MAPAIVSLSADGSQYVLSPTAAYDNSADTVVIRPTIARLPSAYRILTGIRLRF